MSKRDEIAAELHELYENAPCGYHSVGPDGTILRMNQTELGWLGFSRDELIGRSRYSVAVSPDSRAGYEQAFERLRGGQAGAGIVLEAALLRRDGSTFDALLRIAAIRDRRNALLSTRATVIDISASKRAQADARLHAVRLRAMSQRIVEIQERERRSLSAELHDRIGQDLACIDLDLHVIKDQLPEPVRTRVGSRLDDAIERLEGTVEVVRDVAGRLHPPALDDYGLAVTLRSYAEKFAARTGIRVIVEADDPALHLSGDAATTLFRVGQEAFTNVLEHARADTVHMTLEVGRRQVALTIADNGCGFDPQRRTGFVPRGLGLLIMQERLRAVHGSLRIVSQPGAGTAITARVRRA